MDWLDISFIEEEVGTDGVEDVTSNLGVNNNDLNQPSSSTQVAAAGPEPQRPASKKRRLSCDQCHYNTLSRGNLYRHKKNVHAKVKRQCSVCSKTFSQAYDLNQHQRSVHENNKLLCELCSKTFNNRFTFRRHKLMMHTGQLKHVCKMCGKKFFDKNSYFGHINNHVKSKPYSCTICKKAFAYKTSLQRHSVVCVNHDPDMFKCAICDKRLKSSSSLKAHTKGVHGNKDQICRCGKSFSWRSALHRHKKSCKLFR